MFCFSEGARVVWFKILMNIVMFKDNHDIQTKTFGVFKNTCKSVFNRPINMVRVDRYLQRISTVYPGSAEREFYLFVECRVMKHLAI